MTTSASARRSASIVALTGDPVEQPTVTLERVRTPDRLEPADDRLVGGVEEDQVGPPAALAQLVEGRLEVVEEAAGPHVDDGGQPRQAGPAGCLVGEVGQGHEQLRRQVVDDVPPGVLEHVGGRRPARRRSCP